MEGLACLVEVRTWSGGGFDGQMRYPNVVWSVGEKEKE